MVRCVAVWTLLMGALSGCALLSPQDIDSVTGEIDGTLVYGENLNLPASSQARIMLQRLRPGRRGENVAVMTIPDPGATPIAFTLPYARARIDPAEPYVLRARVILGNGRVAWREAQPVRVLAGSTKPRAVVALRATRPAHQCNGSEAGGHPPSGQRVTIPE